MNSLKWLADTIQEALKPDVLLQVHEWANANMVLTGETSARPGPYEWQHTPYWREVYEQLSVGSPATEIAIMKGAQIGATLLGIAFLGYTIIQDPAPTMIVMPTEEAAKDLIKIKFGELMDAVSGIQTRMVKAHEETLFLKRFQGGFVYVAWAGGAVRLRSVSVRKIIMDEVDAYPASTGIEGDPVDLAKKRASSFGDKKKILLISTPLMEGASAIQRAFLAGDQRYYHVPCPHCRHKFVFSWDLISWPVDQPQLASMACPSCRGIIHNHHKTQMMADGEWVPAAPGPGKNPSYHVSALYAPVGNMSWGDAATEYVAAQDSPTKMQAWINTVLGLPFNIDMFDEKIEIDNQFFSSRLEKWNAELPMPVLVLTAAADVQHDRLEVLVYGWDKDGHRYAIAYQRFHGDPKTAHPWRQLTEYTKREFVHESGRTMKISILAIDSGYLAEEVYSYCITCRHVRAVPTKGISGWNKPFMQKPSKTTFINQSLARGPIEIMIQTVAVDPGKESMFRSILAAEENVWHWPDSKDRGIDGEFFIQLTNEKLAIIKKKTGEKIKGWIKTGANEVLDMTLLNIAARELIRPNLEEIYREISIKKDTNQSIAVAITKKADYRSNKSGIGGQFNEVY